MERNRIYISGKNKRTPDESAQCFIEAERMLVHDGWKEVFNSYDLGFSGRINTEDAKEWFELISSCDAVFFLDGWLDSSNCIAEHSLMKRLYKQIIYEHYSPIYLAFEKTEKLRNIIHEQSGFYFCEYRDGGRKIDFFYPRVIFCYYCFTYLHINKTIIEQLIRRERTALIHILKIYEDLKYDRLFNDLATRVEKAYLEN